MVIGSGVGDEVLSIDASMRGSRQLIRAPYLLGNAGAVLIKGLRIPSLLLILGLGTIGAVAQSRRSETEEFGPVVQAYLGYLQNEQEVVDDRVSRREISHAYYVRNSNRIRALREVAIRLARESGNDYLPELEAVARDEFTTLFEHPPNPVSLKVGNIVEHKFRFLAAVRSETVFYVFARLDPYEIDAAQSGEVPKNVARPTESGQKPPNGQATTRPRRAGEQPNQP